jgi:hypothetical protein
LLLPPATTVDQWKDNLVFSSFWGDTLERVHLFFVQKNNPYSFSKKYEKDDEIGKFYAVYNRPIKKKNVNGSYVNFWPRSCNRAGMNKVFYLQLPFGYHFAL